LVLLALGPIDPEPIAHPGMARTARIRPRPHPQGNLRQLLDQSPLAVGRVVVDLAPAQAAEHVAVLVLAEVSQLVEPDVLPLARLIAEMVLGVLQVAELENGALQAVASE